MTKERILVVDDESGVRSSLRGVLEDEGYLVETCETAEDALRLLESDGFDLVILDVWLPRMDGVAALAEMRKKNLDSVVVVISRARHD